MPYSVRLLDSAVWYNHSMTLVGKQSMGKTVKIAISLPDSLLEAAERRRQARGETRSEFFRHAAEDFLRREAEREDVERYVRAYRQWPESAAEVQAADHAAAEALGQEPWA